MTAFAMKLNKNGGVLPADLNNSNKTKIVISLDTVKVKFNLSLFSEGLLQQITNCDNIDE